MQNSTELNSGVDAALQAGMALAETKTVNGVPVAMVPKGAELQVLDKLLDAPRFINEEVPARSVESFLGYYNRFANPDSTIMAEIDKAKFTGVLDYHGAGSGPAKGKHRVTYCCPETEEWEKWKGADGDRMTQEEFATFLEDNHLQIYRPSAAEFQPEELDVKLDALPSGTDMLEIARTLQVHEKSNITSATNLQSGAIRIDYQEDINGTAGAKGQFEIPKYFVITPQLFKDGKAYLLLCRLKYRKAGPSVQLWYELVRPAKVHEAAVKDVVDHICNGKTDAETGELIAGSGMGQGFLYEVL